MTVDTIIESPPLFAETLTGGTLKGSTVDYLKTLIKDLSVKDLMGDVHPPGYPDRFGHYQYTAHGRIFFSCDPRADEVHIDDIATHLSRICRFGGATKRFLSVAEHCWICSHIVPEEVALEALLHDASEAYIGDVIRPMKYLPVYGDIYLKVERGIETAVAARFGLKYPWNIDVRKADEVVVGAEIEQNIASKVENHLSEKYEWRSEQKNIQLYYWKSELAEAHFRHRFHTLAKQRGLDV